MHQKGNILYLPCYVYKYPLTQVPVICSKSLDCTETLCFFHTALDRQCPRVFWPCSSLLRQIWFLGNWDEENLNIMDSLSIIVPST